MTMLQQKIWQRCRQSRACRLPVLQAKQPAQQVTCCQHTTKVPAAEQLPAASCSPCCLQEQRKPAGSKQQLQLHLQLQERARLGQAGELQQLLQQLLAASAAAAQHLQLGALQVVPAVANTRKAGPALRAQQRLRLQEGVPSSHLAQSCWVMMLTWHLQQTHCHRS